MTARHRTAQIWFIDRLAGELRETDEGFEFSYDYEYLSDGIPIAYTYPLQTTPFRHPHLPHFFENLVAEGWLRKLQSQIQKIDENDRFGLLLMNGRDLAGAVTVIQLPNNNGEIELP